MLTDKQNRYFFDQDNDGHWYLVCATNRKQWNKWLELDSDDSKAWKAPAYARELGSHPNSVTFENPR